MTYNNLVIVGNGLDMNHGLDTSFKSFFEYLPFKMRTEWETYLNKYNLPNETWYNFEEIISIITNECFNRYLDTYLVDKNEVERDVEQQKYKTEIDNINRIYKDIYYEFREFIRERNINGTVLNKNISQFIKKDTPIISFNYTNLVKEYSNNVYYIHGSIDENFIVFGYSLRTEFDHIDPEAAIYDKNKFRELLNYVRYLVGSHDIKNENLEFFVEEYIPHVLQSSTGKGGWNISYPESFIKECEEYVKDRHGLLSYHHEYYDYLSEELKSEARYYRLEQITSELNSYLEYKFLHGTKHSNYSLDINSPFTLHRINQLIIIGHGLEADLELFRELFENLTNLSEVILFVYNGEPQIEIERKIEQIKKFTACEILLRSY